MNTRANEQPLIPALSSRIRGKGERENRSPVFEPANGFDFRGLRVHGPHARKSIQRILTVTLYRYEAEGGIVGQACGFNPRGSIWGKLLLQCALAVSMLTTQAAD